jgi:crossover junction endodeoxyribonuclease RuvC
MTVLGIDPGLAATGWGLVRSDGSRLRLVDYGTVATKSGTPQGDRLRAIYDAVAAVIDAHRPDEAAMESLFFSKNVSSAMQVSEARGVLTLLANQRNLPLVHYTPNAIKQAVSGTGSADKKIVQNFVRLLLGLQEVPKPDHAADALAAAITHLHTSRPSRPER